MLKDQASSYSVSEGPVRTLGTTTAVVARSVDGVVKNSDGTALEGVFVSGLGAPADPADMYREVHAIVITDDQGRFMIDGLWPDKKYKINFQPSSTSMGQSYNGHAFWVNRLTSTAPPADVQVKLCDSKQTSCTESPGNYNN